MPRSRCIIGFRFSFSHCSWTTNALSQVRRPSLQPQPEHKNERHWPARHFGMAKVFANPECNMYGEKKEDWKCQLAPSKSVAANDCRAAKLKINFYFLCVCVFEKSTVVPVHEAACAHIYHIFIHGIESSFPICHLIQARIVCRVRVCVGGTYDFDIYVISFELSFVFFSGAERSASKTRSHRVYCAHNCFHVRLQIQTTKFNIENNAIIFTENICSIGVWQQTMFARLRLGSRRFFSSVRQEILGETFSSFWMADKVCLAQMHTKLKLLIFAARL